MEKTLIEIKNKANEIAKKYEYEYKINPYYRNDCFGVELNYKSLYDTLTINIGLSLKTISSYEVSTKEYYPISYDELCIAKELIDWWYGEESEVI